MDPALFTTEYWREQGLIVGEAPGRGSSLFLQATPTEQWVLRPYRRTRAFQELRLTAALFEQGLPVPRPVAGCVTRYGLTYEAALITVRITGAKALAELLVNDQADEALLHRVGVMIRHFHQTGLDHVDLNARNILIDSTGTPWLIDLDRCRLRAEGKWQEGNLDRLERSVNKFTEAPLMPVIYHGYRS